MKKALVILFNLKGPYHEIFDPRFSFVKQHLLGPPYSCLILCYAA
jgi:hypothetical protein